MTYFTNVSLILTFSLHIKYYILKVPDIKSPATLSLSILFTYCSYPYNEACNTCIYV